MTAPAANQTDRLREAELAFFGRIAASVSHELNNSVTVIAEVNGLLDDLVAAAEKGGALRADKLRSLHDTIARQTLRSETIIKQFNRFAHSADDPVKTCDAREALETLVALCQRFAVLKKARIELDAPEAARLTTNPFRFLHAVFLPVEAALRIAQPNDTVTLRLAPDNAAGAILTVKCPQPWPATGEEAGPFRLLDTLASLLMANISVSRDRKCVTLTLPASLMSAPAVSPEN